MGKFEISFPARQHFPGNQDLCILRTRKAQKPCDGDHNKVEAGRPKTAPRMCGGLAQTSTKFATVAAGSLYANRNNNGDAAEDQSEIADAKQTEARLVC